jgi:hypothetical protein
MNRRHFRWITLVVVGFLVLASTTPALAMKPTELHVTYVFDGGTVNCETFFIHYLASVHLDGKIYYDKNGNPVRTELLGKDDARVWNESNPDIFIDGQNSYHQIDDLVEGGWTQRGLQWDIIVPGQGPILFYAGNFAVDNNGNIVKWAGSPKYDTEALCQALAH